MKYIADNESASVATVFYFITGLAFFLFYYIVFGYSIMDGVTNCYNLATAGGAFYVDPDLTSAQLFLQSVFYAMPILIPTLMIIVSGWLALRERFGVS